MLLQASPSCADMTTLWSWFVRSAFFSEASTILKMAVRRISADLLIGEIIAWLKNDDDDNEV
jgi:hypothetical protein